VRAAQEVRAILDALEVATAPPPPWPTRARRGLVAAARGSARVLRRGLPRPDVAADAPARAPSELST
jgi:hypothetical protein